MKTMSKRFKTLLGGGCVFLFYVVAIIPVEAQICIQPPPGMTGWWPGDGNTNDIVGDRNALLRDNATTGPGFVDGAFVLDGAGDFIEVPHDSALNFGSGDFTVDLWVNFNSLADEQILVEKYIETFAPSTRTGWSISKLSENIVRFFGGGFVPDVDFGVVPNTNIWIHYALRRQAGVFTAFVNGVAVASAANSGAGSGNVDSTSSLKFGHRGSPNNTPGSFDDRGFFLNGHIDEVELFVGRALDNAEILAIFNAGRAGKCKAMTTVEIAIHPGSFPNANSINPKSKGVIPVAILSTNTFDATTVDPQSVKFGPAKAEETHRRGHNEDINGDGKRDLVLHFRTQDTGIVCGNTSVSLTGITFSGQAIKGSASIRTVGCK